jgi:hypothetical protein
MFSRRKLSPRLMSAGRRVVTISATRVHRTKILCARLLLSITFPVPLFEISLLNGAKISFRLLLLCPFQAQLDYRRHRGR